MLMKYLFILFIIFKLTLIINGQQVYIQCVNQLTQNLGKCKLPEECPSVLADIKQQKSYTKCNVQGDLLYVCCSDESNKINQNLPHFSFFPDNSGSLFDRLQQNVGNNFQSFDVNTNKQNGVNNFQNVDANTNNQNVGNNFQNFDANTNNQNFINQPTSLSGKLHERKCHEYQQYNYEYVYSGGLAIGAERKKNKIFKCLHQTVPLIVGGKYATENEFPHMALIGHEDIENPRVVRWHCGGSLISERFVLTAAHCVRYKFPPKYVRLGEYDIADTRTNKNIQDFQIEQSMVYITYTKETKYHDIALLKLNRDVSFNLKIMPACLPSNFDGPERRVIATGWGQTSVRGNESEILQKVVLDKFTFEECNNRYLQLRIPKLPQGVRNDIQMCAGSKTESKDTCQGDSGGPLQIYNTKEPCMYDIIGITSFGRSCGDIGTPGIYTRVSEYIDWIQAIIWPNES